MAQKMELREELRSSLRMFRNGMFIQCKFLLENLKKKSRETATFIDQSVIENNSIVCQIICCQKQNKSTDFDKFTDGFETLIRKIRNNSVFYSNRILLLLSVEIVITCNYISWLLYCGNSWRNRKKALETWTACLSHCEADATDLKLAVNYVFYKFDNYPWTKCVFKCLICRMIIVHLISRDLTSAQTLINILPSLQMPIQDMPLTEVVLCAGMKGVLVSETPLEKRYISIQTLSDDYSRFCLVIFKLLTCTTSTEELVLNQMQTTDFQLVTRRYIKAFAEFKKKSKSVLYFEELKGYLDSFPVKNSFIESRMRNLIGCSLCLQNYPHLALRQFHAALIADENNLLPLYNISVQYRLLKLADAEIDALKLLISQMIRLNQSSASNMEKCLLLDTCLKVVDPSQLLNFEQLCYVLAHRLLQLKRYNDAAIVYLKLIGTLIKNPFMVQDVKSLLPHFPSVKVIYHEAAFALVFSQRYHEAITLADEAKNAHVTKANNLESDTKPENDLISNTHKLDEEEKTKCSFEAENISTFNTSEFLGHFTHDVTALIIKAYSLLQMEEDSEAFELLHVVLITLKSNCKRSSHQIMGASEMFEHPSPQKRTKIEEINEKWAEREEKVINKLEGFVYNCKALIQLRKNNVQDALHNFHLSLMADPDNVETRYNYTLLLIKVCREKEGFDHWLQFRKTFNMVTESTTDFETMDELANEFNLNH